MLEAFDDEGVLLMADDEDSRILRSQIGDNPSHTLLLVADELPRCVDELWPNVEQFLRLIDGEDGDGNEEEGVDWLLHSSTSPFFTEEEPALDPGTPPSDDDGNLE